MSQPTVTERQCPYDPDLEPAHVLAWHAFGADGQILDEAALAELLKLAGAEQ